jgi:hypothetical protein
MSNVTQLDVCSLKVAQLEENMIQSRKSAVEFESIGEHETAALYAVRVDMMLDEWNRRRAA